MSEPHNPPKLLLHKPKKGSHGGDMGPERVVVQQQQPPVSVKPPFWYRYRAGVGALLLVNLGIGGYILSRPKAAVDKQGTVKPEPEKEPKSVPATVPAPVVAATVAAPEHTPIPKAAISEEEQRQVLQWVLEERRKVKTRNRAEKARIDEEKRVLKQLLRGGNLPPLV